MLCEWGSMLFKHAKRNANKLAVMARNNHQLLVRAAGN